MENCPICKSEILEDYSICWSCNYDFTKKEVIINNAIYASSNHTEQYLKAIERASPPIAIEVNGTLESPYAELVPRIGAIFIDSLISTIIALPFLLLTPIFSSPFLTYFFSFVAYQAFYTHQSGQTLGKKLFHIKVIRVDGQPISLLASIVRAIFSFVSLQISVISLIIFATDKRNQIIHDYIASTVVIYTEYEVAFLEVVKYRDRC